MFRKIFLVIAACALSFPAYAEVKGVISSIKPIHSLVENVLGETGTSGIIVGANNSPHGYHLKPSQVKTLEAAKIIFYVDDDFETFLVKPLQNLDGKITRVDLIKAANITLLETRAGGTWEVDNHEGHHEEHKHGKKEHHANEDMHVWLSPKNAIEIVKVIAKALGKAYPAEQKTFDANAAQTIKKLELLDKELKQSLAPFKNQPYIVFHDAFHYFEKAYGLTAVGSITLSPEQAPSAKRIQDLRTKIASLKAVCVFSEAQFSKGLVNTVSEGMNVKTNVLDEHGANIKAGPELYFTLLRQLAANISGCLKQ